jgi:hypothetical protein
MTFLSPRQLGAVDDSDEEMQLINNVDSLDLQLKQAGCPCDENLYVHLFQDLNAKPLAKKLKLWRFRKELLRKKFVATQLSRSAASGETAATSPPVIKQETERERKFEEPPFEDPSAQLHDNNKKPKFRYITHPDGLALFMSPLHVAFAAKSVELLCKPSVILPVHLCHRNTLKPLKSKKYTTLI